MTDPIAVLSTLAELLSWVGLVLGALFLIAGYTQRALARSWRPHDGAVVSVTDDVVSFRWFGTDGELHEGSDDREPGHVYEVGDAVTVFATERHPASGRIDSPEHGGKALRTVGWVLFGLGLVSVVSGVLLLFLE
ncbi:hypothetical protein CLV46_0976 [Diaminobutyricimonas aerilata]|uniref:DUF3592 domain-containing protein n=1 Tax=Diaminobutyricimonas aerilata TaxID=1162967 RepID=A0A2M9CHT4_9MICO|nr:DUF3592 domain-containing protein [Diaminobutyricimonas aerilata]PJJ71430.1 hypothetical protein CLV46_0976 [Diaminobutyricimonas aerilata]